MKAKLCRSRGCNAIAMPPAEFCPRHEGTDESRAYYAWRKQDADDRWKRGAGGALKPLYQTQRWRAMRAEQLRRRPTCVYCGDPATVVDHNPPHRGDEEAFWDASRLQSLCAACNEDKTTRDRIGGHAKNVPQM
jgi:hypothetical protein